MRTRPLTASLSALFLLTTSLAGCEVIREATRAKTFACDLRTSGTVESPQCWAFDNIREADGSALQVRGLCLGLQSELVKDACPRDDEALVTCLAAGDLIPEEIQDLSINLEITSYLDVENSEERALQIEARELACAEGGGAITWSAAD